METENHAYEAEYADFDLDQEDPGKFEDPYQDPLERQVAEQGQQISAMTEWLQNASQQVADQDEAEVEQQWDELQEQYPVLLDEAKAEPVADKVDEVAKQAARERGDPDLADDLIDDPAFVRKVFEKHFQVVDDGTAGGHVRPVSDSEAMFIRMAQEARSKRLSWDDDK